MYYAPIIIFAFNRLWPLKAAVASMISIFHNINSIKLSLSLIVFKL